MSVLRIASSTQAKCMLFSFLTGSNSPSQRGIHRYDEGVRSTLQRNDVIQVTYGLTKFFGFGRCWSVSNVGLGHRVLNMLVVYWGVFLRSLNKFFQFSRFGDKPFPIGVSGLVRELLSKSVSKPVDILREWRYAAERVASRVPLGSRQGFNTVSSEPVSQSISGVTRELGKLV